MIVISSIVVIFFVLTAYAVYVWLQSKDGRNPNNVMLFSILLIVLLLLFAMLTYTIVQMQKQKHVPIVQVAAEHNAPNVYEANLLRIEEGNVFVFDDTGLQLVADCAKGNISIILIQGTFFKVENTPTENSVVLTNVKGLQMILALPTVMHILAWN